MKVSYKFSNLLGTVYKRGNVIFSPDGNILISPVGNRVSAYDLKNNKSETLPIESKYDITTIALSPNGNLMLLVNAEGEGLLCSLLNRTVISQYHFSQSVHCVKFSPDGSKFAATKGNKILLFQSPGYSKTFNPFILLRTFFGPYDEVTNIDWSTDSRVFCASSKDMNTHIYGAEKLEQLVTRSTGGHKDAIVGSFFLKNSLDLFSVSHDRIVCYWKCNYDLDELTSGDNAGGKKSSNEAKLRYKKQEAFSYHDVIAQAKSKSLSNSGYTFVSSCDFSKKLGILVTGLTDGSFHLHEMPSFTHIHTLTMGDQSIDSICFNSIGDWLALGCSQLGQLVVWEWQSETYIMKQQGHFNSMSCVSYSPDGQYLATGGDDHKVKVWNTSNGFCFVTFTEHTGGITGVTFTQNGKVIVTSSLDGSVRAFDLQRYRNFRTFTSPRQVQFGCLAVDLSGELICAAGKDVFEIFVWSMRTGKLLEVLAGHQAPVPSLSFSPVQPLLVSTSWDGSVKIWDVYSGKTNRETIQLSTDGLAVAHRPDGKEIAVCTLRGHVIFYDSETVTQKSSIETRSDFGYTRKLGEVATAKKVSAGNAFDCLSYSSDGRCILVAGQSPYVCIYSVADKMLLKRFKICQNLSMDGTMELLDKRRMTEAGSLDEFMTGENQDPGLPGVRKGDMSLRKDHPEVRVTSISFSPTGQCWAATSSEGVLIYSLDNSLIFDPFEFGLEVTPNLYKDALSKKEYSMALLMALRLNIDETIREAVESVPTSEIAVVIQSLPERYVFKLLEKLAPILESSPHIQYNLEWCTQLLTIHGPLLKSRGFSVRNGCMALQKVLTHRHEQLRKICDFNKYTTSYILSMAQSKRKMAVDDDLSEDD